MVDFIQGMDSVTLNIVYMGDLVGSIQWVAGQVVVSFHSKDPVHFDLAVLKQIVSKAEQIQVQIKR